MNGCQSFQAEKGYEILMGKSNQDILQKVLQRKIHIKFEGHESE